MITYFIEKREYGIVISNRFFSFINPFISFFRTLDNCSTIFCISEICADHHPAFSFPHNSLIPLFFPFLFQTIEHLSSFSPDQASSLYFTCTAKIRTKFNNSEFKPLLFFIALLKGTCTILPFTIPIIILF